MYIIILFDIDTKFYYFKAKPQFVEKFLKVGEKVRKKEKSI